MKTAMQEMIEYLENTWYVKEIRDWEDIKINILEKEKEQIINAFNGGRQSENDNKAIDHYNFNYNQNK